MLRRVLLAGLGIGLLGCGLVLGVDGYRDCVGAECTGASDATTDATADASTDAPVGPACVDDDPDAGACPSNKPACHAGRCVGVRKLAQGASNHVCAVMTDDSIFCWGMNLQHQISAAGGFVKRPTLVPLPPAYESVVDLVVEVEQTCVLAKLRGSSQRDVLCWGDSTVGGKSATPTRLGVTESVSTMAIGSVSACALLASGNVSCWGENIYGEIGCPAQPGACNAVTHPVAQIGAPKSLTTAAATNLLAVGRYQSCAVDNTSKMECFGNGYRGNLADGKSSAPSDVCCGTSSVSLGVAIKALKASDFYACVKDDLGAFQCWGDGLNSGCAPTGKGSCSAAIDPTKLDLGIGVLDDVYLGWRHACALQKGALYCWGANDYFVVSPSNENAVLAATKVSFAGMPNETIVDVAPHRKLSCALTSAGRVLCWGQNEDAWLTGVGSIPNKVTTPTEVRWR
jgi:alpha-tubulin suppressor-like RCC1 family protein